MACLSVLATKRIFKNGLLLSFGILLLWAIWLSGLSGTDIINDLSLPPKLPLLVFIPWIIFSIVFYIRHRQNKSILNVPMKWPVLVQSFRIIVEILILYTFYKGILPKTATFEGLNYDILMGITAIPIGLYVYSHLYKYKWLAYLWNILGMFMILFVGFIVASSLYFPRLWQNTESIVSPDFFSMPYFLLAGFLAPLGIFIHVFSLAQLNAYENSEKS